MLNFLLVSALVCFVLLIVGGVIAFHVALVILPVLLYFLPAIIAWRRGHAHRFSIFLLNVLLGWTMLGWFALLAWSVVSDGRRAALAN